MEENEKMAAIIMMAGAQLLMNLMVSSPGTQVFFAEERIQFYQA
jgi:hypothetical protein